MLKASKERLRNLAFFLKLSHSYGYELRRFFRHSSRSGKKLTRDQMIARLFQKAHSIEKGLAMIEVRPAFGRPAWSELKDLLRKARDMGLDRRHPAMVMVESCIVNYVDFHQRLNVDLPNELKWLDQEYKLLKSTSSPSTIVVERAAVQTAAQGNFRELLAARHSFRMFGDGEVDERLLLDAIELATCSPSVCNRQSSKVYAIRDTKLIARCLEIQGGNRGFGEGVKALLIVTGNLEAFRGARERYQVWIDGGLFSMNLLNGLAFVGLAACPLNWSAEVKQDKQLRRILPIGRSENVIMMVGVGNLREESRVARSPRRNLQEVYQFLS